LKRDVVNKEKRGLNFLGRFGLELYYLKAKVARLLPDLTDFLKVLFQVVDYLVFLSAQWVLINPKSLLFYAHFA